MDSQSSIGHFMWGVGSISGIDDIIPFSMTFQECAMPVQEDRYVLSEGQPYFITITVNNLISNLLTRPLLTKH